jgi:glycosyltransferase involved in cell wall biosynthesis
VRFLGIPAGFTNPYQRSAGDHPVGAEGRWVMRKGVPTLLAPNESAQPDDVETVSYGELQQANQPPTSAGTAAPTMPPIGEDYGGDLFGQVDRFAQFCLAATRNMRFDVIHAHDWMTYPAGLAIASVTGKPRVVHVHSTEFDRSGIHVNQRVYDIERRGMHGAMRVIAVSQLTKNVIMRRYSVPGQKVEVVYNGVDLEPTQGEHMTGIQSKDKVVLYFGRITYQKGPEYFIHAAKRVLEMMPDVKFVVAGSGDQARGMIELAAHLGIGHKVLFTGFLRGRDIQRVFSIADLYVMPSVSEPFGIAPLEAMGHDVPVLISKSSGVSEVLSHALKVDFWDITDMADKIIAVLRHPPLSQTLREHAAFEVRKITWDGAASRCEQIYGAVANEMRRRAVMHN